MGFNAHPSSRIPRTVRILLEIAAVVALYILTAQVGLQAASKPGIVTPLWPPSGLALAALMLLGWHPAVGIWIGSFLVNLWLLAAQVPPPMAVAVAATIATGSTGQALLIVYCLRRWFASLLTRPDPRMLAKFVGVVALACVIGATVGVVALWGAGLLTPAILAVTWGTWWIGDLLGIVIFGPILLMIGRWARGESIERQVPPMLFGLGVGLAIFLGLLLWTQESAMIEVRFDEEAQLTVDTLQQVMATDASDLSAVHGLFAATQSLTRSQFYTYTSLHKEDSTASGLRALEWLPLISAGERLTMEEAARAAGFPDFQFTELNAAGELVPAGERDTYFPIYYVEPLAGNEAVLGFDPTSDPVRWAGLAKARDRATPHVLGPLPLVQSPENPYGILSFHPVYREGVSIDTVEARRENLIGFVLGVFDLQAIVTAAQALSQLGTYDLYLFDLDAPQGQQLIYTSGAARRRVPLQVDPALSPSALDGGLVYTRTVDMDGHKWLAVVKPMPGFAMNQRTMIPWIVLAVGLAFATLLAAYLARRQQAEANLRESRGELVRSQAIAHLGSFVWDKTNGVMTWSEELRRIMGCADVEVSERLFFELVHPEDREIVHDLGLEAGRGEPFICEYRIVRPDGTVRWLRNQVEKLPGGDGATQQWFGTFLDITEERLINLELQRAERLLAARLHLSEFAGTHAMSGLLTAIVDRAESQTGSRIGFLHLVEEEQTQVIIQTWSTSTVRECAICPVVDHFRWREAGVMADCIRDRQPRIFNSAVELARLEQLPVGHVELARMMLVPVVRGDRVVAILAVGNKPADYDENDLSFLEQFAEAAWDIALRKRAEEALQASEARYRHLIENSHDLVQSIAPDGRFLYVNRNWIETLGYTMEDLATLTLWDIVHPESQIQCEAEFRRLLHGENVEVIHPVFIAKNGHIVDLEGTATARVVDGEVVATHAFVRDVTEERQTERIQAVQYAVSNILADSPELDAALPLVVEAMARQLGWQVAELWWRTTEGTNLTRSIVWYEAGDAELETFVTESMGLALQRGENVRGHVWTEKHAIAVPNYTRLAYPRSALAAAAGLSAAFVIPIDTGSDFLGSLLFFSRSEREQDARLFVTLTNLGRQLGQFVARKIAETELRAERSSLANRVEKRTADLSRANAQLERAMRAKDEFLANMSHELRTPLNGILVLSESLHDQLIGPLNERQVRSVGLIEESGRHLLALINDILDLSKLEVGKLEIQPESIIVHDVCLASLAFIKQMAQKKGIQVVYRQSTPNLIMAADSRRLKQILVNLLSNAVKFTDPGGEVVLEVNADPAQHAIEFVVQDTGIGIPKDAQAELFQPFAQVDSSLSRQHEGTGLGLALVRNLVDLHRGSVTVESEGIPGKGSRFAVVLPWRQAHSLASAAASAEAAAPRVVRSNIAGAILGSDDGRVHPPAADRQPTILLAEDNEVNVSAYSDFLSMYGYQVVVAHTGVEALACAAAVNPDLILMDVQMPEMDGLEAMRCLRADARFAQTPIIALTALAMTGDRERCLAAGANRYVTKPVGLKDLARMIEELRAPNESANR